MLKMHGILKWISQSQEIRLWESHFAISYSFVIIGSESCKSSFSEKRPKINFWHVITGSRIELGSKNAITHEYSSRPIDSSLLRGAMTLCLHIQLLLYVETSGGRGEAHQTPSSGECGKIRQMARVYIFQISQCFIIEPYLVRAPIL